VEVDQPSQFGALLIRRLKPGKNSGHDDVVSAVGVVEAGGVDEHVIDVIVGDSVGLHVCSGCRGLIAII